MCRGTIFICAAKSYLRNKNIGKEQVLYMLAILNKYKILFIILSLVLLAVLLWLAVSALGRDKTPSRGVFVLEGPVKSIMTSEGCFR